MIAGMTPSIAQSIRSLCLEKRSTRVSSCTLDSDLPKYEDKISNQIMLNGYLLIISKFRTPCFTPMI
jgi:hypothetical protein